MSVKIINKSILKEFKHLYDNSTSRIILFDYDGTLMPITAHPDQAIISDEVISIVNKFSNDPLNRVIIISGRDKHFLDIQFLNMNVTLIAEHGYFIKYPLGKWNKNFSIDLSWKHKALPIFKKYEMLCNGSKVEEKECSIAWHYRNVDALQIDIYFRELLYELYEILQNNSTLQILEGKRVLEIKSKLFNKGTTICSLIENIKYDFILAVGDDKTDEDLFSMLPENAITIRIGNVSTVARYIIEEQSFIYVLLNSLIDISKL